MVYAKRGWGLQQVFIYLANCTFSQAKIQKHQTFEAELAAHSNAIHTLKSTGKGMIDQQHFASVQIRVSRVLSLISLLSPVHNTRQCILYGYCELNYLYTDLLAHTEVYVIILLPHLSDTG